MNERRTSAAGHYTTRMIGELLGVDSFTVARWIDEGYLQAFRTPGGHRRVTPENLRRFFVSKSIPLPAELVPTLQKVVVVDGDRRALASIARSIRAHAPHIDLLPTESGIEGLLLIAHEKPSVAIIDIHMPNLDGFEVSRRVRGIAGLARIKIILMSGSATEEMREQAVSAGADVFLAKPFQPEEILRHLGSAIIEEATLPKK